VKNANAGLSAKITVTRQEVVDHMQQRSYRKDDLTVSGSEGNELQLMTQEIGAGVVLVHQKDAQLVRSVWHLSADLSIKEYLASVRYIQQDLDHVLTKYPPQCPVKREREHSSEDCDRRADG
jgi:thiamine phosphate synthase YjbQ (UPF0047 family)